MEVWDIYDKDRNLKDKLFVRGENNKLEPGDYELIIHVAIFNQNGEMLIQKRQSTKKKFPDKWDLSAGGHAIAGEYSQDAAEREVMEELGYEHDFSEETPYLTINYDCGFDDIYIIVDNELNIDNLILQPEEVQSVTWANNEEIKQLIDEGKFIDYCPGYIDTLFFLKDNRSMIRKNYIK